MDINEHAEKKGIVNLPNGTQKSMRLSTTIIFLVQSGLRNIMPGKSDQARCIQQTATN